MFVEVFIVGLLAGISPGPDFVVVMRNSLSFGARVGAATALGIAAALFIHITYTVLGYSVILAAQPRLFAVIQAIGAAYLVWLAIGALRAGPSQSDEPSFEVKTEHSLWQGFRDGFLCNALNPKCALFFLSIFAQFITPGMAEWVKWAYGLEIVIAVGGWFVMLAVLISAPGFRQIYQSYEAAICRLLGGALLYLAARIILAMYPVF